MRRLHDILADIAQSISARGPMLRAKVGGRRFFFEAAEPDKTKLKHRARYWIYLAQIGTLDKLESVFSAEMRPGLFELTAIARNLFENLIWLKLFRDNEQFGLVFYRMLIGQQLDNHKRFLAKALSEIELLKAFDERDTEALHAAFDPVLEGEPSDEDIAQAQAKHQAAIDELDEEARRSFSIYAFDAKTNGYGFQAMMVTERALPTHHERIDEIEKEKLDLESAVLGHEPLPCSPKDHWNWRQRAEQVGMLAQYEFLYRYTSSVLHSTPLNIITEKALIPSEDSILAEYVYGLVNDILDTMEPKFEGDIDAIVVNVSE